MEKPAIYQQIFPKDELLKKFIKLYYIHKAEDSDFYERITYFPNFNTTINIYQHSSIKKEAFCRTHTQAPEEGFNILLVAKFDCSREIITKGPFNKLSIVFHPLGLNHFVVGPLSVHIEDNFSYFTHFGNSFDQLLPSIFETDSLETKRVLLDDFFLNQYKGFEEKRLIYAIDKIMQSSEGITVQELVKTLKISRKTLLRIFKKHLDYTPREFQSIVRFRKALNHYQQTLSKPNFAALAYEAKYYDQSDLNHHFKARTGLSPNELFSKLKTVEEGLYWQLEHVPKVQDSKKEVP